MSARFSHPTTTFRLAGAGSLQRRLYESVRERILSGALASGERLPSSRELADALGVSRVTVIAAFDRLVAEGYVEARRGAGSFVRSEDLVRPVPTPVVAPAPKLVPSGAAARIVASPAAALRRDGSPPAFRVAVPALDEVPVATWARLAAAVWRRASPRLLSYQENRGLPDLRAAIARYLEAERGVRSSADQVIVTNGSQQALRLVARVLVGRGDAVWMEEPGYYGARAAFVDAGARVRSVPIDREGLVVDEGARLSPRARLAYVTPRHQMPLGVALSAPRRLALLAWAAARDAWIVEDDYDGELLLRGRPLPTLHELDGGRRVVHVGTFSLVLFPGLRVGYVVVPEALVETFASARAEADLGGGGVDQAVLARFVEDGHLHRHVRRMRRLYAERATVLEEEIARRVVGARLHRGDVGLHAVLTFRGRRDEGKVAEELARRGVEARPLALYRASSGEPRGLVLGYGAVPPRAIRAASAVLGEVLARR